MPPLKMLLLFLIFYLNFGGNPITKQLTIKVQIIVISRLIETYTGHKHSWKGQKQPQQHWKNEIFLKI